MEKVWFRRVWGTKISLVPQGGSQKSRIQKSKELYSKLLRHLKWYVYLRHAVLAI